MRLLGGRLAGVGVRLVRQIARPILALNIGPHLGHGFAREVGRIGPHIRNMARLVQLLCQPHGLPYPKAQPGSRRLLEGGRNEGGAGAGLGRFVLTAGDGKILGGEAGGCGCGLFARPRTKVLAVLLYDLEAIPRLVGAFRQLGKDLPVFLRHKGANLPFALHNEPYRDRLHPPGRQATRHLGP